MLGDQAVEYLGDPGQSPGQVRTCRSLDLAIGDVGEAIALGADDPPPAGRQRGIKAEDDQARLSATSSLIS
jgi:hypothetical protein